MGFMKPKEETPPPLPDQPPTAATLTALHERLDVLTEGMAQLELLVRRQEDRHVRIEDQAGKLTELLSRLSANLGEGR